MKNKTMLLALLVASCVLTQSVFAQYPLGVVWDPDALAQFLFPGMNREWLRLPDVLYYVILPFIAAFTVIYGILRELRIFRTNVPNKVNIVLAFCMAFMLLPSGILTFVITILYAGSAFIGILAFGIVFLIGIIMWAYGTTARIQNEYTPGSLGRGIRDLNKSYSDLQEKLTVLENQRYEFERKGQRDKVVEVNKKIIDTREEITKILEQQAKMMNTLKSQTQ